jgi:thioredoxin 1
MITKSENLIHATIHNFDTEVLRSKQPVVVDFYADWCAPCKMLAPVFQRLAEEYAGRLKFAKVNVDEEAPLADRFGISGIPALVFFKDGAMADSVVGLLPPGELLEKLDRLAGTPANF